VGAGLLKNLGVESLSNFPSLRANAAVYSGRWIYEVVLETAGIQQLGWATNDCEFSHENGVGDSPNSYAYDGKRKKVGALRKKKGESRPSSRFFYGRVSVDLATHSLPPMPIEPTVYSFARRCGTLVLRRMEKGGFLVT
jgi:hypothetical protein